MTCGDNFDQFVRDIQELWTGWQPTPGHLAALRRACHSWDYEIAKSKIMDVFIAEHIHPKTPVFRRIQTAVVDAMAKQGKIRQGKPVPVMAYRFVCIGDDVAPQRVDSTVSFWVGKESAKPELEDIERLLPGVAAGLAEVYGGQWVRWQSGQGDWPDDGLRGLPARKRAEQNILAGPDCPGRRFLLAVRESRTGLEDKKYSRAKGEPVRLGATLKNEMRF